MTGNSDLNRWLAAGRADAAQRTPDPMIEQQLLARVRERSALQSVAASRPVALAGTTSARNRSAWWMRWSFGVPVVMTAGLLAMLGARLLQPAALPPAFTADSGTPFFALVASEAIAAERAPVVVASQVPRTALADYGLPIDPARADEPVAAEFLVSGAGVVLAVRFRE